MRAVFVAANAEPLQIYESWIAGEETPRQQAAGEFEFT
jgi:hypothetical protein